MKPIIKKLTAHYQLSFGRKRFWNKPDLVPVKNSYLYTGKLDSKQYDYFLNGILKEQFDKRREIFKEKIKSQEDLRMHLNELKKNYLKLLGLFPEKSKLNPIVTGKIERKSFNIEKVAFESREDHHVTALLYLPKGNGPFPGILHIPGHSSDGKADKCYQRIGNYFALNGFVVLQIDPVCQGERSQISQDVHNNFYDNRGNAMHQSTTCQHDIYNQSLLLLGSSIAAWEVWDNIRSIDYLCTRPEVDSTKIGVTGFSGGGTQTTYLASIDSRIKAVSLGGFIATHEEKIKTIGTQDSCQQLYSEGKYGIEEQDFLFMAAPLPILILSTYDDYFSFNGSKAAADELLEIYKVLGWEGRFVHFSATGGHCMPDISLVTNIKWMNRWLKEESYEIVHDTSTGDFVPLKATYVTTTKQVFSHFKNEKSIVDFTSEMLDRLREEKNKFLSSCSYDKLVIKVSELVGYDRQVEEMNGGSYIGSFKWEGLKIEKHFINRDRGFKLPALIIKPENNIKQDHSAFILSGCYGKMNELASNIHLVQDKLQKGYVVLIVDVSNTGELRSNKKVALSGVDYEYAIAKICKYAGKTLLGYRAEDLVIAKNYLKMVFNPTDFELLASGKIGPSAIHAAFINGCFSKIYLKNSPNSWEKIVTTHFNPDLIGIIVPNVLKYYDLNDLIKIMTKVSIKSL